MSNTFKSLTVSDLSNCCFFFCLFSAKLVDNALASGKIYEGDGFNYIKESFENGTLHLIGLLSDGGVHSRLDQLQVC
jgi:bisphosphoglycerate-independent phosphoglycerate mutase (AlkP superfamily)